MSSSGQRMVQRLGILAMLVPALAFFWFSPQWFRLDADGMMARGAVAQISGPLIACVLCGIAAWRRTGVDRFAWGCLAVGSGLYVLGNVAYLAYALAGVTLEFPAPPEIAFLVMAPVFGKGLWDYGQGGRKLNRADFLSYVLFFCALTIATLFVLEAVIGRSVLSPFGTVTAWIYVALWSSVAASCVITLMLYRLGERTFRFGLLTIAVCCEATADFLYITGMMDGTYVAGGVPQMLWVLSCALIGWAAIDELLGEPARAPRRSTSRPSDRFGAQAVIPAGAFAFAMLAGLVTHEDLNSWFSFAVLAGVLVFGTVAGFREYWIIGVQRGLRSVAERSRTALAQSREQLSSVLESTTDSILVLDLEGRIQFFNGQAQRTVGVDRPLRVGHVLEESFPELKGSRSEAVYRHALETGKPSEVEEFYASRNIWLQVHVYPTGDGLSLFFRDITERRRALEEITHMAHHDSLTGLANRVLFHEELRASLAAGEHTAVILLDLDHFKEVNDSLGHPLGDRLLCELAKRLSTAVGDNSRIAARLGGDEFAVILSPYNRVGEAQLVATRILDAIQEPYDVGGQIVRLNSSAGIAVSHAGQEPDELFRNADIALYAAKSTSRGSWSFYQPEMEAGLRERQQLRTDLATALQHGQFELLYQPLVDIKGGRVSGFEALMRWRHPRGLAISPAQFIPLAEETGLIRPIGEWALHEACCEAVRWPVPVNIAVNLSSKQFTEELTGQVSRALADSGLDPQRLELEITESVLLEHTEFNLAILGELKALGVRIALDDFGTGYSSLAYLQRFQFDKIKVDRSFIEELPVSTGSQAIVSSVLGLARALGMRVTAEGVETETQYAWVRRGFDEAQGYIISRPVPAREVPGLIERIKGPLTAPAAAVRMLG